MQLDDVNYSRGIRSDIIDGLSNILQPPTLVRKFKSLIRTCLWHLVKFVEVYDMIILLYPRFCLGMAISRKYFFSKRKMHTYLKSAVR